MTLRELLETNDVRIAADRLVVKAFDHDAKHPTSRPSMTG